MGNPTLLREDPVMAAVTLLTAAQVSALLGLHVRTVWRMADAGQIPAPIRIGERGVRWRLTDLQSFIAEAKR